MGSRTRQAVFSTCLRSRSLWFRDSIGLLGVVPSPRNRCRVSASTSRTSPCTLIVSTVVWENFPPYSPLHVRCPHDVRAIFAGTYVLGRDYCPDVSRRWYLLNTFQETRHHPG